MKILPEGFKEIYYQEEFARNIPPKVAISGVALLSLLPEDLGFLRDFLTFPFYEQSQFYSSGTRLTECLCLAYPRIRAQNNGLKLRNLSSSHYYGPDYIEPEAVSKNIIYYIGSVILGGSSDLTTN